MTNVQFEGLNLQALSFGSPELKGEGVNLQVLVTAPSDVRVSATHVQVLVPTTEPAQPGTKFGTTDVSKFYLGTSLVTRVYQGSDLVFGVAP